MVTKPSIWPQGRFGVPQITPYTYRDGQSLLELIKALRDHVVEQLHPSLQHAIDQLVADVESEYEKAHNRYVDGIQEFQRIHDAFMADVNASLIALNDHAASDLVNDEGSILRETLDKIFANHQDVANLQTDFEAHRHATNETIGDFTANVDTALGEINHELDTRLSHEQMIKDFDVRTRVNTQTMDGETGHDRLTAAVATGDPVQLDEHIQHLGNIPGFWDTPIYGTGTITTPDGEVFTVEPRSPGNRGAVTVNNLYVNGDTGTPDGDGLTPATAFDSTNTVYIKVLRGLTAQQAAGARWVINMTGTLDGGHRWYDLPDFPNVLHLRGYDDCRIVQTNSENDKGLWFEPCPTSVEVTGIHFEGFRGVNGYGVYARYGGHITVKHCEFTDCQYGAAAIQNMVFFFNDNTVNPSVDTGFMGQYNSTGQFNRNTLIGNGTTDRRGVFVTRNTICHVDDNYIKGYRVAGVMVEMASRASLNNNTFDNNVKGVTVAGSSEWANNNNDFYNNNTSSFHHYGAGKEQRMHANGDHTGIEYRIGSTNRAHGDEVWDLTGWQYIYRGFYAGILPSQWLQWPGKYLHVRMHGHTNAPNTRIDFGGYAATADEVYQSFGMVTLPKSGYFQIDAFIYARGTSSQRAHITAVVDDEVRHVVNNSNVFMGRGVERSMTVRAYGANARLTTMGLQTFALG